MQAPGIAAPGPEVVAGWIASARAALGGSPFTAA